MSSALAKFMQNPFGKEMHKGYTESFLNMRPAPEYASGEVLLSSLYRAVGFPQINEGLVPERGKFFLNRTESEITKLHVLNHETWKLVINTSLESPKPSQASERFMLLCPMVPWIASYSGSARQTINPWNPGNLFARMVRYGSESNDDAKQRWRRLYNGLSVDEKDDPWAKLLRDEFQARAHFDDSWQYNQLGDGSLRHLETWQLPDYSFPAKQFVQDLDRVIELKEKLTRRQWISILESLLRIASVAHVTWLCEVNSRAFTLLRNAIRGDSPGSFKKVVNELFRENKAFWHIESPALPPVRKATREFLAARVGINYFLYLIENKGLINHNNEEQVGTLAWYHRVAEVIYENHRDLNGIEHIKAHQLLIEKDPRILACKKGGIGKNINEFARHVLGQRQAVDSRFLTYDQGFFAKQLKDYKSAPWILSPGPIAVMMLCHCCTIGSNAPRTVEHLCEHLEAYKIGINPNEMASCELGRTLRNLGLVLDSPDAEGGMVVLDPFRL